MTLGSSVTKDRHRWVLSSRCDESIAGIVHVLSDLPAGSVDVVELEVDGWMCIHRTRTALTRQGIVNSAFWRNPISPSDSS